MVRWIPFVGVPSVEGIPAPICVIYL